MVRKRQPRRLAKVETLPPKARHIAASAFDSILAENAPVSGELRRLNAELCELGLPEVSKSSFYRYAKAVREGKRRRPKGGRAATAPAGTVAEALAQIEAGFAALWTVLLESSAKR